MRRRFLFPVVMLVVLLFGVSAHATLVDMYDGTIYDTETQLSWLQAPVASGAPPVGVASWDSSVWWIGILNYDTGFPPGLTGWRLPAADPACGIGTYCPSSELGHLYAALGNAPGGPLTNTGPFFDIGPFLFWTGTDAIPNSAYVCNFSNGVQSYLSKDPSIVDSGVPIAVMAVRPGARTIPCTEGSVQACTIANGSGQQTCESGTWSACVITSCNTGYVPGNGVCVASQPNPTPVGYSPGWLMITLLSLTVAGGVLLREKTTQQ